MECNKYLFAGTRCRRDVDVKGYVEVDQSWFSCRVSWLKSARTHQLDSLSIIKSTVRRNIKVLGFQNSTWILSLAHWHESRLMIICEEQIILYLLSEAGCKKHSSPISNSSSSKLRSSVSLPEFFFKNQTTHTQTREWSRTSGRQRGTDVLGRIFYENMLRRENA